MSTRDRVKASDVFRETQDPFAQKVPIEEVFPGIKDVAMEVIERGHSEPSCTGRPLVHRKPYLGEYIACHHADCYKGGFSVGQILRDMVRSRETDRETTESCQGYEGSPKGKRRYRDCIHYFQVKVHVDYWEPATGESNCENQASQS